MNCDVLKDLRERLNELVPTLEQAAREVAALLQQGNVGRGLNGLHEVLEALQYFHEGLDLLIKADGDALYWSGFSGLREKLDQIYPPVFAALEANDMVTLADLLEFELADTFAQYYSDGGLLWQTQ
ncbi:MAG: hypothetical protein AB1510_03465 [Bacillota bacterium]